MQNAKLNKGNKTKHDTMCNKMVFRIELTKKGLKLLLYLLEKECVFRKKYGIDTKGLDDLLDQLVKQVK